MLKKLVRGTLDLLADSTFVLWLLGCAVQTIFIGKLAIALWRREDLQPHWDSTLSRLALLGTAAMILHMMLSAASKKRSPLWGLGGAFNVASLLVYRLRSRCLNGSALVSDELSCPNGGVALTRSVEVVKVATAPKEGAIAGPLIKDNRATAPAIK